MTARKGWTIPKTRNSLYRSARFLGDVQAVRTGRVGRRAANRVLGRYTGRALRSITRGF